MSRTNNNRRDNNKGRRAAPRREASRRDTPMVTKSRPGEVVVINEVVTVNDALTIENLGLDPSSARAVAQVQASVFLAKKFPRDEVNVKARIVDACQRIHIARNALYAYPRGGQKVIGPSIRLAEVLAQQWGNIEFGVCEVDRTAEGSMMEAYCWDLQANMRSTKRFWVPHVRDARGKQQPVTSARDLYEVTANQGSRRVRACILAVIPADVVELAVDECRRTVAKHDEDNPRFSSRTEQIEAMVMAFKGIGVDREHLERERGYDVTAFTPGDLLELKAIFKTVKDNQATPLDFFPSIARDQPVRQQVEHEPRANSPEDLGFKKGDPNPKTPVPQVGSDEDMTKSIDALNKLLEEIDIVEPDVQETALVERARALCPDISTTIFEVTDIPHEVLTHMWREARHWSAEERYSVYSKLLDRAMG